MAKIIWTATCASFVAVATVALMAQDASSQQTPSAQQTTSSRDRHVIVTGCLSLAPAKADDPTGTAGTAATDRAVGTAGDARATDGAATDAAAALPTFVVTSASLSTAADSPNGANSSDKQASAATPLTYRIVGNHALLSEHVGEQVEVTGTLDEQDAAPAANAKGAAGSDAKVPVVHLESGKTLAPVCGPGA
jgi:hypothetical protein